jgi:hypothetical protein
MPNVDLKSVNMGRDAVMLTQGRVDYQYGIAELSYLADCAGPVHQKDHLIRPH